MKWRFTSGGTGAEEAPAGKSISQRSMKDWSPGCMAGFFGVFLLAGIGFGLIFLFPAINVVKAWSWTAVDCEILSSSVASHSGDSTTYSIEVSYRYTFDGAEYTSDRYEFLGGSSSGYDSKKRKVDALPEGSTATCYVDPEDPTESVLERGFSWPYLFALLPLVFVAIGGGGVFWALTGHRLAARAQGALSPSQTQWVEGQGSFSEIEQWSSSGSGFADGGSDAAGPIELEEQMSPWGKLGCLVGIMIFWNGIVSLFVWQLWSGWRSSGSFDGCMAVFLLPFVLVGLALLAGIPYQMLALANPRPKLVLSRSAIPLGGSAQLNWAFVGSAGRLENLRIWVEGSESATYRRGTNSHTDTEVFARIEIVERGAGASLAAGSALVKIPADTMHTFEASRNKINWTLNLRGSIARWPDVMSEFPLVVLPREGDDR